MADRGWKRPFEEPIPLPHGRRLVILRDAGHYILKLPESEHGPGMAGGHESAGPGRDAGWADNVCADRYASGDKSSRRARVQSRPERPPLG
jgi:hypothetical protein